MKGIPEVSASDAVEVLVCPLGVVPGLSPLPVSRRQLSNNRQRGLEKVQSGFVLWMRNAQATVGKRSVKDELGLWGESRKPHNDMKPVVEIGRDKCSPFMDNVSRTESVEVDTSRREVDAEDVHGNVEGLSVRPVMENKGCKDAQT